MQVAIAYYSTTMQERSSKNFLLEEGLPVWIMIKIMSLKQMGCSNLFFVKHQKIVL
jgi:hypothetical protein